MNLTDIGDRPCPNCGKISWDWTNWIDDKIQSYMFRCNKCDHLFIIVESLKDVTMENPIGQILMGINEEENLIKIMKMYGNLHKRLKILEREGVPYL